MFPLTHEPRFDLMQDDCKATVFHSNESARQLEDIPQRVIGGRVQSRVSPFIHLYNFFSLPHLLKEQRPDDFPDLA